MTSFAQVNYSAQNTGVARADNAAAHSKSATGSFDGARGAATLLLAAVVSAVFVVANQVIDTWTDGHMLAGWMVMWVLAFAALALLTAPARRAGVALRAGANAWAESRRRAAEDERTWKAAISDPRIMAELNRAMGIAMVDNVRKYY